MLKLLIPIQVLCLGALLATTAYAQEHADLIATGGRVATLSHGEGFVQALAVKDGRIYATGTDESVLRHKGPKTTLINLDGRTVIPGLNDSHLHATRGGRFFNLELRWDGVPSLEEALAMLKEQAARTPKGQWVRVVGGWSPYQFKEKRMPTVAELNAAAPNTPVFVLFLYSKAFINRAGVETLGLTKETVAPKGGRYQFEDGGAELIAEPNPTILYKAIAQLPQLTAEEQVNSTLHFYRDLNRFGLTSAIDAGGGGHEFPEDYTASQALALQGGLPLRVSFFLFPQRPGHELEDFQRWTGSNESGKNQDRAKPGGYVLHGGGEFLVWAAGDFENFMAPRPSVQREMDRSLAAVAGHLIDNGWPLRIHATYAESIDRILTVFEGVNVEHPFDDIRWAIDHAETIRPEQIQRIQRLGGGIAIQNRMAFAGEYFLERYGKEATATAPPLRALLESGIPLGAGTDATRVSSHNPWLSLYWMISGRTVGGTVLYPKENRLTRTEALRLFTVGSAWFSQEEDVKGTLRPGQYADFAVLSSDYFTVPEEQIRGIESVLTVVGGEVVYGAGPFAAMSPELPVPSPEWSPVAIFGGYYSKQEGGR
ncbi:MAG: putative amidohydrolase YtcJ [Gammaproteobacteria bacterium]|jgi:predicted amidohydrolase YtcJ